MDTCTVSGNLSMIWICVTESKYVDDTEWIAKTDINLHLEKDLL